jgi:hypothetical protein
MMKLFRDRFMSNRCFFIQHSSFILQFEPPHVGSYGERTNLSNASNNNGALDRCTTLPSRATKPKPSP